MHIYSMQKTNLRYWGGGVLLSLYGYLEESLNFKVRQLIISVNIAMERKKTFDRKFNIMLKSKASERYDTAVGEPDVFNEK